VTQAVIEVLYIEPPSGRVLWPAAQQA